MGKRFLSMVFSTSYSSAYADLTPKNSMLRLPSPAAQDAPEETRDFNSAIGSYADEKGDPLQQQHKMHQVNWFLILMAISSISVM